MRPLDLQPLPSVIEESIRRGSQLSDVPRPRDRLPVIDRFVPALADDVQVAGCIGEITEVQRGYAANV